MPVLAALAFVAFLIGIFVLGTVHSWAFWLLLGMALLAADAVVGDRLTGGRWGRRRA